MADRDDEDDRLRSVALQNLETIRDARQRAEEELLRANERLETRNHELAKAVAMLKATLEATTDGILVTDERRKVTSFNRRYTEMWQLPAEIMSTLQHQTLLEHTSQQFRSPLSFLSRVNEIYASSPPETFDLLELADGRVFERFSRIQSVEGRNVGRVWSFRDITETRRATEALRRQEERLRVTLTSIGDGVITTDTNGRVASLNPVAESLTGWTTADAQGKPLEEVFEIVNEQTRKKVENPALRSLREGQIVGLANHTLLISKDGTERPIDDSAAPIKDDQGHNEGAVLIFRDVSRRRRDEQELRRNEQELADFFDNAALALHWVGADGTIIRVNQAELELLGYSRHEYLGRNIADFHADQEVICDILRRLKAGESLRTCEARLICKDGSIKHVLIDSNGFWRNGEFVHTRCFTRDITRQKVAEEALRQSELQLRLIMDHAPVFIASFDTKSRFRFVNRGYAARFGLRPDEMIGKSFSEILGTAALQAVQPYIDTVLSGRSVEFEADVPYQRIGRRFMRCAYEPECNRSGEVEGWVAVIEDISERRQAEQSKIMLGAIVESSDDAIISKTLTGQILTWNSGAERLFGYSSREAIGQSILLLIPPDRHDEEASILRRLRSGEYIQHYETVRRTKDGRLIDVSLSISPLRDANGQIIGASKIARDVTARKRAEQVTHFLADASAVLSEVTDLKSTLGKVAGLAVPFFADWCAIDMQTDGAVRRLAVNHTDPNKVQLVHELDRKYPLLPSERHGVRNVLRTGSSEWVALISDDMLREQARDDEHLRMMRNLNLRSYICVPLKSRGKILGAMTFATAESGRAYTAEDLRAAEDLSHRAVIAIENANLLSALKESDRRKDEFLAMLAHELRNPLAPVRNATEIIRAQAFEHSQLQFATEVIDRQLHQMTRLVDDLLDVSRISTGKIVLRKERIALATAISNAVEASRPLIEQFRHRLTIGLPEEPIYLNADFTRVGQVLLNLLNNAAKYTDPGGQIWLTAERDDDHVMIRVKDTGIGISPEMLPRIFEMFLQVDLSLDRAQGGLGIGLTLVERLVTLHGGTIAVHSPGVGQGSEFVVRLPIAPGDEAVDPSQVDSVERKSGELRKYRILVADDNRDSADSLTMLLRIMGHQVETAHDGQDAIEQATRLLPDVIFLDIGMPKLDGYEVARRIRRTASSNVTLIAMTGWGQDEDRRLSREAGFNHHLVKPVDFNAVQELLSGSHLKPVEEPGK